MSQSFNKPIDKYPNIMDIAMRSQGPSRIAIDLAQIGMDHYGFARVEVVDGEVKRTPISEAEFYKELPEPR